MFPPGAEKAASSNLCPTLRASVQVALAVARQDSTDPAVRTLANPVRQQTVAIHKWPPKRSGRVARGSKRQAEPEPSTGRRAGFAGLALLPHVRQAGGNETNAPRVPERTDTTAGLVSIPAAESFLVHCHGGNSLRVLAAGCAKRSRRGKHHRQSGASLGTLDLVHRP